MRPMASPDPTGGTSEDLSDPVDRPPEVGISNVVESKKSNWLGGSLRRRGFLGHHHDHSGLASHCSIPDTPWPTNRAAQHLVFEDGILRTAVKLHCRIKLRKMPKDRTC